MERVTIIHEPPLQQMNRLAEWMRSQRSSTRLSFALQISCRVVISLLSLVWTPLLLNAMGRALNGLFLNFHKVASLGVTGDLGMGGLVNIQTSRLLGQRKEDELQDFLSAARGIFLAAAVLAGAVFLLISPVFFHSLGFATNPGVGSLAPLAAVGALTIVTLILNGYASNLNYGCSNTLWPILPTFLVLQLSLLGHWLLASRQAPLWAQYLPYLISAILGFFLSCWMIRTSHPAIARVQPINFRSTQLFRLGTQSFWLYLYSVATGIYTATDTVLISAGFGPELVPVYQYNYRLYELAMFVVQSASLVSLPKITQWIVSPDGQLRQRGVSESLRLNKFQTLLGCCAVFVCLNFNDPFVALWLGRDLRAPLSWQIAFAMTMGITAAGMLGSDLVARCGERGIRFGGITVMAASVLNLIVSFIAMKRGSILGIALATSIAMTAQSLVLCWYSSRHLRISWWRLSLRNWLLVLVVVPLSVTARTWLAPLNAVTLAGTIATLLLLMVVVSWCLGITIQELRQELHVFQSMFARSATPTVPADERNDS